MTSQSGERSDGRRIGAAAALLAASVLLSRMLGYVREMVLAAKVGVSPEMDAYSAAFLLPDILNHLLAGGALAIAFIPVYTRARKERGEAAAEKLFATVLGTLGLLAVLFTAVMWIWAEPIVSRLFGGFDPETADLTLRLTRIVLPAQVFFITGGVLRGALMSHGRFGAQAASGIVYNLGIIAGGLLMGGALGVEGFAWGALVGAIVGPFGLALADAARCLRVRIRIAPADREFLAYLIVALPLMIGVSLLTVDEWYEKVFGDDVGEGVLASLRFARQLMLVPVAVVGQAIAAAALPTLSRLWSEGRRAESDRILLRTLQVALVLALLTGAAVAAAAQPLVDVLYHRGRFTADDVTLVAGLLVIMCFAVPGWVLQQVSARAFYARGDTLRPMLIGTATALLVVPLYWMLAQTHGAAGLAAAGAVGVSVNALATVLLARFLHGAPALGTLLAGGARALAIALPAAAAARAVQLGGGGLPGALIDLALAGIAFGLVVVVGIRAIGDEAMREVLPRVLRSRR